MSALSDAILSVFIGLTLSVAGPGVPASHLPPSSPTAQGSHSSNTTRAPMLGFLSRLFAKRYTTAAAQSDQDKSTSDDPQIEVYDEYGRAFSVAKRLWVERIFPDSLERSRDDPDQLARWLVEALDAGWFADALEAGIGPRIVKYGELLQRTDPDPIRGGTILGMIYTESGQLDEAQEVLQGLITKHGEIGIVLFSLAKVQARKGAADLAEETLWRALELDPNNRSALNWYLEIQKERGEAEAGLAGLRRLAAIEGSWMPQLDLARHELEHGDLASAMELYKAVLSRADAPAPADMLLQISGDLGNHGYITELLELVEPRFVPEAHGLLVATNLFRAALRIGRLDGAGAILEQLYSQGRPDWKQVLGLFSAELTQARDEVRSQDPGQVQSFSLTVMEGPLWMQAGSPLFALSPKKSNDAPAIAFFGSTVITNNPPEGFRVQHSRLPGRISRGLTLLLAEGVQLETNGRGLALILGVENRGSVIMGAPFDDSDLCQLVTQASRHVTHVAAITLDTRDPRWELTLHFVRLVDGHPLADMQVRFAPEGFGMAALSLMDRTRELLVEKAGLHATAKPAWYTLPTGPGASEYLVRLDQLLAVRFADPEEFEGSGLTGEREIIDGTLQLCLDDPTNHLTRILLADLMLRMKKARPQIPGEYRRKIELLQRNHPLATEAGQLVEETLNNIF